MAISLESPDDLGRMHRSGQLLCEVLLDGFFADSARTIPMGTVAPEVSRLLEATRAALDAAIAQCKSGGRLGNLGATVQQTVESAGFSVVKQFTGHGIGRSLHEDPSVRSWGKPGHGMKMRPGLELASEPMVNLGEPDCEQLDDGWTVVTRDGSVSAHFEHTVAITAKGPWVLTRRS